MQNVRNFVIIAHIDHGKSTLADRLLELTKTIPQEKMRPQFLDMMDLEREKGITIKMQPVRMSYSFNSQNYILNLIDTPGHIDFSYEVSRSLAAVEGAVLLVDASKGIQAQTIANLDLAKKQGLVVIPVINKIDVPGARTKETKDEMAKILEISPDEIFEISAKKGTNVEDLLKIVIEKVPPPEGDENKSLRALIFDSKYDAYKGVVAYVRIKDGKIRKNEKVYLMAAKENGDAKETGFFEPEMASVDEMKAGEIGYIATGIKEPGKIRVGDTITKISVLEVEPLPGYREPKPMVYASVYPEDPNDYELLKDSLNKLKLNDASFTFEMESREALGRGFRCGFLGSLHAEIVSERLLREFGLNLIISSPSVIFKIINGKNEETFIKSASDWPKELSQIKESQEPWVRLEIMTPLEFMGKIMEIMPDIEAKYIEKKYFSQEKTLLIYEAPLREIIVGFYDNILRLSQGYASMNYTILGFKPSNLVKMEILVAGKKEEAFSRIIPEEKAYQEGSKLVKKLKELLPNQQFAVALQAAVSGKIIARETMGARGKDVIAPLYGGDYTRKKKLLEKQKRGKKELKEKSQVRIPTSVFFEVLKR